ncbi:MAG: serine/threonine protein kinase [Planctomycetota bacterium]|jgi:serine/threonine protein kinase
MGRKQSGKHTHDYVKKVLEDDRRFAETLKGAGLITPYQYEQAFKSQRWYLDNGKLVRIVSLLMSNNMISYEHAEWAFRKIGKPRKFCRVCGARYKASDDIVLCVKCNNPLPIEAAQDFGKELVEVDVTTSTEHDKQQQTIQGEKFGKYVLVDKLGAGSVGAVYKGYDAARKEFVAVKILHPWLVRAEKFLERFMGEAAVLAKIHHPKAVKLIESGTEGEYRYITMELLEGMSLADSMKFASTLPVPVVINMIYDVAEVLNFGFEEFEPGTFVHRDIKPGNIFQCDDGVCKLMDFGLVKSKTYALESLTQECSIMGTIPYMSPEQAAGDVPLDIRSDLFSLGSSAYHLLTGQFPFRGENVMETRDAIINGKPIKIKSAIPDLPVKYHKIFRKLLSREIENRFQTPRELLKALQPFREENT